MTSVTVFGSGNMGSAIAGIFANAGVSVQTVGSADEATITGDIVVLAVPYGSIGAIAQRYGKQFAGKIVVDITNPLDFETFDSLVVPVGSSAAAELAMALPEASILKAFNTTFAATLASAQVGDNATTVLIAGDDAAAKGLLSELITAGGLKAVDAGALSRAHELEALGFLQLTLAAGDKISWAGGFAVIN